MPGQANFAFAFPDPINGAGLGARHAGLSRRTSMLLGIRSEYQLALRASVRHGRRRYDAPPPDAIKPLADALATTESTQPHDSLIRSMLLVRVCEAEVDALRATGELPRGGVAIDRLVMAAECLDLRYQEEDDDTAMYTLTRSECTRCLARARPAVLTWHARAPPLTRSRPPLRAFHAQGISRTSTRPTMLTRTPPTDGARRSASRLICGS